MIKGYIYAGLTAVIIVSFGLFIDHWHYGPIADLKRSQSEMTKTIKHKDIVINDLSVEIQRLVENNKVTGFESYWKGMADANDSVISDKLIF